MKKTKREMTAERVEIFSYAKLTYIIIYTNGQKRDEKLIQFNLFSTVNMCSSLQMYKKKSPVELTGDLYGG